MGIVEVSAQCMFAKVVLLLLLVILAEKGTPQSVVKIRHVLRPMFSSLSQLIGFFSIRCIPTKTPMATTMSGNIMPGIVV